MFKDSTLFEKVWLFASSLLILYLSFTWSDTLIGTIASLTGIICVVLSAKGKVSSFAFGTINAIAYGYVAYSYQLYGEAQLNLLFYLPLQFVGVYLWKKNLTASSVAGEDIKIRFLGANKSLFVGVLISIAIVLYSIYLSSLDSRLFGLDSAAVVISIAAQILMLMRYAEQWLLWILVNVITIILWAVTLIESSGNDWTILVMYIAFLINSVYGAINWYSIANKQSQKGAVYEWD